MVRVSGRNLRRPAPGGGDAFNVVVLETYI